MMPDPSALHELISLTIARFEPEYDSITELASAIETAILARIPATLRTALEQAAAVPVLAVPARRDPCGCECNHPEGGLHRQCPRWLPATWGGEVPVGCGHSGCGRPQRWSW